MKPFLGMLTLLLLPAGCSLFGLNEGSSSRGVLLGETFTLEEGASVQLGTVDATVRFVEVLADSRCPLGVDCVWAGEVKILLEFTPGDGDPVSFELTGFVGPEGGAEVKAEVSGYRFTLERVDPYPRDGVQDEDPVTATLKVERL